MALSRDASVDRSAVELHRHHAVDALRRTTGRARRIYLRTGRPVCPRCVEVADDHTATDTATISAGDLAELDELGEDELTSEQEYAQALGAEGDWRTCSQTAPSPAAPTTPAAAAARRDGREREPLRGRSP